MTGSLPCVESLCKRYDKPCLEIHSAPLMVKKAMNEAGNIGSVDELCSPWHCSVQARIGVPNAPPIPCHMISLFKTLRFYRSTSGAIRRGRRIGSIFCGRLIDTKCYYMMKVIDVAVYLEPSASEIRL